MNKEQKLREVIRNIVEELCAKGKAYRKKRMAAGEKSSAYLSGRAVKVCKGQIKGESALEKSKKGMAMYGKKAKMDEVEAADNTEFKVALKHLLQKHATNLKRGDDDTEFKLTLKHLLDKHVVKGGEKGKEKKD